MHFFGTFHWRIATDKKYNDCRNYYLISILISGILNYFLHQGNYMSKTAKIKILLYIINGITIICHYNLMCLNNQN